MGVLVWIRVVNRSYNIIIIYIGINLVILYIILKSGVSFVLIFWSCREYKGEEKNIIILNYIYVYFIFDVWIN